MQVRSLQSKAEFNDMSSAGLKLAWAIACIYSERPEVAAVIVGGSVARGSADQYSDLEIGVFWATPPSVEERKGAIKEMGGEIWKFDPYDGRRASEHIGLSELTVESQRYLGTAMVSPIHMTVDTAGDWIGSLIDDLNTAPRKLELAAAIRYGMPLYGHNLIEGWKEKVASFPQHLAVKLVQQNLWLGPWFKWAASIEREDHLVIAQHLVWMQQGIVNVLAALNREYMPSVEYKWVEWLLERMEIKPAHCTARLKSTFTADDLGLAARDLIELGMEVIDLVAEHLPEVNEGSLFESHSEINTDWAKRRWASDLEYTLVANIARSDGLK